MLLPSTLTQAYRVLNDDAIANDTSIALLQARLGMVLVAVVVPTVLFTILKALWLIFYLSMLPFSMLRPYVIDAEGKDSLKHETLTSHPSSFPS